MVCLIPAQVAEIDGNGSGGPRWSAVAGPDSGGVPSNWWLRFGRGMILSTMVCLVGSETVSIAGNGAAAVGGGRRCSRPFSGELSQCMSK